MRESQSVCVFVCSPVFPSVPEHEIIWLTSGSASVSVDVKDGLLICTLSVKLPGIPSVELPGIPSVELPGIPSVKLPGIPSVKLPGIPSVKLPGIPSVELPGIPSAKLPGIPLFAISGIPPVMSPGIFGIPVEPTAEPEGLSIDVPSNGALPKKRHQ